MITWNRKYNVIPYHSKSNKHMIGLLSAAHIAGDKKSLLGVYGAKGNPYLIDLKESVHSKNILVMESSQDKKHALILSWILDFYALDYNLCITNLSSEVVEVLAKAIDCTQISLGAASTQYLNTFKMKIPQEESCESYFDKKLQLSKRLLLAIADLNEDQYQSGEKLIDDFLYCLYSFRGITRENPKSWKRSEELTPYAVYKEFLGYMTIARRRGFTNTGEKILQGFESYLNPKGKMAFRFKEELDVATMLETKALAINLQQGDKLGELFGEILVNEYLHCKEVKKQWTLNVLEETAVFSPLQERLRPRETYSMYRVTVLLPASFENEPNDMDMLCIGKLEIGEQSNWVWEAIGRKQGNLLRKIRDKDKYRASFLLINKLGKKSTTQLMRIHLGLHSARKA